MVCRACGKEFADEFKFCPHCGDEKIANCPECGKESSIDFSYCPYCGEAFAPEVPEIELLSPPPEVDHVTDEQTDQPAPIESDQTTPIRSADTDKTKEIGTYVLGAFSAISLLVSIMKGLVPIYLFEAAGWAGAAWYWHSKKTHSELAKAIVIVLAVLVAIGEVIHITWQAGIFSTSTAPKRTAPFGQYAVPAGNSAAPDYNIYGTVDQNRTGASSVTQAAEIEEQALSLYKEKRYSDARPLFDQACNGGELKSCNYLGYLYAKGLGGAQDTKKAREVYQIACDQGTLSSCASLGSLYQDTENSDSARKYFQKACNGGVTEACDLLRGVK
jgi:transcription elongation factor Elf1